MTHAAAGSTMRRRWRERPDRIRNDAGRAAARRPPWKRISLSTVWQTLGPLASLIMLSIGLWLAEPVFMTDNNCSTWHARPS